MEIAKYIAAAAAGYLLGSVSASVLLSKLAFRRDVRAEGSGNAGATNVARVFGMWAGIATLLADVGKTVLAILLGQWLAGDMGLCIAGIACILGHCWPVYFHFRGGKGVSVGAAIGLMIDWRVFVIIFIVFFVTFALCQIVSVCSIASAVALPVAACLLGVTTPKLVLAIVTGVLVIFMHRGNIQRLLHGTEAKFKPHTKKRKP